MWFWLVMGWCVVCINFLWNCVLSGKSWYFMCNVYGYEFIYVVVFCGVMRELNLFCVDFVLCGELVFVV